MSHPVVYPAATWRNVAFLPRISARGGGLRFGRVFSRVTMRIMHDVDAISLTYMCATGLDPVRKVANDLRLRVSVDGQRVRWNGRSMGLCPDGQTLTSDALSLPLRAGDTITVETAAWGLRIPVDAQSQVRPLRVNGTGDWASLVIIGSSSGVPDGYTAGLGDANLAVTNASISGSRNDSFTDEVLGDFLGMRGKHGWNHAMLQVGPNNLSGSLDEICQGQIDLANRIRGFGIDRITQMVWPPITSSTDGWTTLEGQTPARKNRAAAVAWLRDGAPITPDGRYTLEPGPDAIRAGQPGHPMTELLDYSSWVEAPENRDLWRVDLGAMSNDGLHSTPRGYEPAREPMREWAESLSIAAWPRRAL